MFDLFGVMCKRKKVKELREGFSIYKRQLGPDYDPFFELKEKRRWWGEKLHFWSFSIETLESEFEQLMKNRKAWEDFNHDNQEDEPDINTCPGCGGPADNGHDRCIPPRPYYCSKCVTDWENYDD